MLLEPLELKARNQMADALAEVGTNKPAQLGAQSRNSDVIRGRQAGVLQ